jgi:hypothetical protein
VDIPSADDFGLLMGSLLQFPGSSVISAGLFRPKMRRMMPCARGGDDRKYSAVSEDGLDWMLKLAGTPLAISEYLGYKLAEACQIALPHHAIVETPGGDLAFGSRIEEGLESLSTNAPPIANLRNARDYIPKIYALDMFIANDDRHPGNLIWRRNTAGILVPIAIDFGESLFAQPWPWPDLREIDCNTTRQIKALRGINAWNQDAAIRTLEVVRSMKAPAVGAWLDQAPREWVRDLDRARLLGWWGGGAFQERIDGCMMFCT